MRALTAVDLVRAWEWGEQRRPVDRALALLACAMPGRSRDELAALSLGQRDGLLLQLRQATLGDDLEVFVACPECSAELEFSLPAGRLLVGDPMEPRTPQTVTVSGLHLHVRPVTSADLAWAEDADHPAEARARLLERAVISCRDDKGEDVEVRQGAADDVVHALRMVDPQLDLRLNLDCETCGHAWVAPFDVLSFFWEEIGAQMKQVCTEVDTLARVYGWSEREILAMSAARRQWYIELVTS